MPTYEMFWDCRSCGSEKLLGKTHRHCPACGQPQDPSWRYFPSEEEKVAVEDHVYVGVDWICARCESANAAAADFCVNCGAGKDGVEREATVLGEVDAGAQSGRRERPAPRGAAEADPEPELSSSGGGAGFGLGAIGCAGLLLAALLCGLLSVFWTSPTSVEVTGHRWERTIDIERFEAVSDAGWCDELPRGAVQTGRQDKERSKRKVQDGQTCKQVNVDKGDGTFQQQERCEPRYRDEPVMDAWCSYTVDRWQKQRAARASGEGLSPAPSWPEAKVDGCAQRGCTRQGSRQERYTVVLRDADGAEQRCELPQPRWQGVKVGARYETTKRRMGGGIDCSVL